jgi:hypothetical protein
MNKTFIAIFVFTILAVGLGVSWVNREKVSQSSSLTPIPAKSVNPDELPGIMIGAEPWLPETERLRERLAAIGLPALTTEGTTLHTHQHIDIFINGKQISVPADTGINEKDNFISPIHTHENNAIIHVESPTVQTFTLGQFFDIWGVRFIQECLGGYCNENEKTLQVFSNGQPLTGSFRDLPLTERQEIVVVYGDSSAVPSPIPSTFIFPPIL